MVPRQMFDHTLVVIKGPPRLNRLDYAIPPVSSGTFNQGALVSMNEDGLLVKGLAKPLIGTRPMPMFAIQDRDSYDANSDVGNISGGVNSAVVATGNFEIETTEFVAGTYLPNKLLTAATAGDTGKVNVVTVAPYLGETVVGVVSKGTSINYNGKSVLRFWPVFLPTVDNWYDYTVASAATVDVGIITGTLDIEFTGTPGQTATITVNGVSFVIKNVGGVFTWDFGGAGETALPDVGDEVTQTIGGLSVTIRFDGTGSLIFTLEPGPSSSSSSSESSSSNLSSSSSAAPSSSSSSAAPSSSPSAAPSSSSSSSGA